MYLKDKIDIEKTECKGIYNKLIGKTLFDIDNELDEIVISDIIIIDENGNDHNLASLVTNKEILKALGGI